MLLPPSLRALILVALSAGLAAAESPRERLSLDADWRFAKGDPAANEGQLAYAKIKTWILPTRNGFLGGMDAKAPVPEGGPGGRVAYAQADFDDSGWRRLDLPHDWGVEGPFKQEYHGDTARLAYWGTAWYRKHLDLPASDRGRRIFLEIDGAMAYATVWLNGHLVGGWPYGYASFELDLSSFVRPGADNVLAIRLDNPPESSRWYPGGGIYRNVWLTKTDPIHVGHWGTTVTTPQIAPEEATVLCQATIANDSDAEANVTVKTEIYEYSVSGQKDGEAVASGEPVFLGVAAHGSRTALARVRVEHPTLWSTLTPYRYVVVTTVEKDGAVLDSYETPFGIRTLAFDPEKGFLLNGERLRFQGVCDHHDLGALGTALNVRALERQLEMLQEMGCNAIRTSHNPPAPELLDLCDRLGFVVMDEAFDCWVKPKRPNDYHLLFPDWHEADLRAQLRRDRNHPSVIMWSIGNEIPEQDSPAGVKIGAELQRIVHEEDPTRPVTSACSNTKAGYNGFEQIVDVFGYNYKPAEYPKFHAAHPDKFLFGSETESTVSSRGVYVFPVSEDKLQGRAADFQVSSYDLSAPKWAWPPDLEFRAEDDDPYVGGEFVWTGWDYLGEPTPFGTAKDPARSSYFGIIDLAGFKKDRFYLYQAHWRPNFPMAHLLPHWTWPERVGQVTPVFVYTSGDEAELFLNGQSLGRKKKAPGEYRIRWNDVVYQPGELRVVAYKNGKKWAEDVERTAGPAAQLKLETDRGVVAADGRDLAFVTATIFDRAGVPVPRAMNHIKFSVSGPADIVAVDNGDATSFEPFQAKEHNAFNGLALAIVRTRSDASGPVTVTAQADGLVEGSVALMSTPPAE